MKTNLYRRSYDYCIQNPPSGSTCVFGRSLGTRYLDNAASWNNADRIIEFSAKKARQSGNPPPSAPTMAPRCESAAKSTKLVKSKSSAVVAVGGDSAKIYQKFKNSTHRKPHSVARKSTVRKKKTVSSKRTLDDDNNSDTSDDSDAD